MGINSFPANVALRVVGIGEEETLAAVELAALAAVAAELHKAVGRSRPPSPFDLARVEGVMLRVSGGELVLLPDCAWCPDVPDLRDLGLWAARGLAGSMLLRRDRYTDLRAWALAAKLLTPNWALYRDHPWAPMWLVDLRCRVAHRRAA